MNWRPLLTVFAAGSLVCLATASPAGADDSGVTAASVTVAGGALTISVSPDAGNLGTQTDTAGVEVIRGELGQVKVTDARNAAPGSTWVASAVSTSFTPPAGPAIPASAVGYAAGPIAKVGRATYSAVNPDSLAGGAAVVTATDITGDNTASWNPTISVTVPAHMTAAVYSGSITHSVV